MSGYISLSSFSLGIPKSANLFYFTNKYYFLPSEYYYLIINNIIKIKVFKIESE